MLRHLPDSRKHRIASYILLDTTEGLKYTAFREENRSELFHPKIRLGSLRAPQKITMNKNNPMKRPILRNTMLALVCYVVTAITGQAQGVFQCGNPIEANSPYYFEIDAYTGLFQINDTSFSVPDNATGQITTPAGTLTFSVGTGVFDAWSLYYSPPIPDPFIPVSQTTTGAIGEIEGNQFNGSFQSSAAVYDDLLAGLGEFQVGSGISRPMDVVATPEPGSAALFICGLMLLMRRRIKRVCPGLRA